MVKTNSERKWYYYLNQTVKFVLSIYLCLHWGPYRTQARLTPKVQFIWLVCTALGALRHGSVWLMHSVIDNRGELER